MLIVFIKLFGDAYSTYINTQKRAMYSYVCQTNQVKVSHDGAQRSKALATQSLVPTPEPKELPALLERIGNWECLTDN